MTTEGPNRNRSNSIAFDDPEGGALSKLSISSLRFNWHTGRFDSNPDQLPLFLRLLFHLLACICLLAIPILLISLRTIELPYRLIDPNPPAQLAWQVELIRWIILLGIGYTGYVLTLFAIVISVFFVNLIFSVRKKTVPQIVQKFVDSLLWLNIYIARLAGFVVLYLAASVLFPLSIEEQNISMFGRSGVAKDKKEKAAEALSEMIFARNIRSFILGFSIQFFVQRVAAAAVFASAILLIEKIIIRSIATNFYYRSFGHRRSENNFALKLLRKLKVAILNGHPELEGTKDIVKLIMKGCNRSEINSQDLAIFIKGADADKLFQILDNDAAGSFTESQLSHAIAQLYEERDTLRAALDVQASVIDKLDTVFLYICNLIIFFAVIMLFQVNVQGIVAALTGITTLVLFLSSGPLKTAVESILFVIFTHPFDVGDRVLIKGEFYIVVELGLWSCTFEGPGGCTVYISNSRLRTEMIVNNRRSPFQDETITFPILPTTPTESLEKLEQLLSAWVKQNPKDFLPRLVLGGYTIENRNTMRMFVKVFHRSNFQDEIAKDLRTRRFVMYFKDAMKECQIEYSPPIIPVNNKQ